MRDWLLTELGKTLIEDLLRNIAPDQIWVNSINASCLIELANRVDATSCLFVHESFGFISDEYLANDYEVMFHSALNKANLVIFGSEYSKLAFRQKGLRSNGLVLNSMKNDVSRSEDRSLELRNFRRNELGIDPESRIFLSMATFEPRKRISDILEAFGKSESANSFLLLVGHIEGDRHSTLMETQAKRIKNVIVFPVTKDPSYFYSVADVLILASESETYPLVLQEAIHWDLLRMVAKYPGYIDSCSEETAQLFEVGDIDHLESLISMSESPLQATQSLMTHAKLDFFNKEKAYQEQLNRILKNLSVVNVGLDAKK